MDSESSISVRVEGVALNFRGVGADDHVLAVMRESGAIYEQSVLLKILHQLNGRKGAAVDAGAFIGTQVLAFEADPETFTVLSQNLKDNDARSVVAQNVALGNRIGRAELRQGAAGNRGTVSVDPRDDGTLAITTIDVAVAEMAGWEPVVLIKIDVEGAEIDVLQGAEETITRDMPLLCVEAHGPAQFAELARFLHSCGYGIVDCLGGSPTYIADVTRTGDLKAVLSRRIWQLRSRMRGTWTRAAMRRLAIIVGPWQN
jgi:FkbM family methyltransferase